MEKKRLEVLAETLGISTSEIQTRESAMGGEIVLNCTEFVVKEQWYNVLKDDELNVRLSELLNDCYTTEELIATYNTDDAEVAALSSDIDVYLMKIDERDGYFVYQTC